MRNDTYYIDIEKKTPKHHEINSITALFDIEIKTKDACSGQKSIVNSHNCQEKYGI